MVKNKYMSINERILVEIFMNGVNKKVIPTNESPLLQQHTSPEPDTPVLNWMDASRLYDKLSIDGFIKGRQAGGIS